MKPLMLIALLVACTDSESPTEPTSLKRVAMDQLLAELDALPERSGEQPNVTFSIPHQQLDQPSPLALQEQLIDAVAEFEGVLLRQGTPNSLPGAIGWVLGNSLDTDDNGDLVDGREFGHQHRGELGSMHMFLPMAASSVIIDKGWAVLHPFSVSITGSREIDYLLVYAPRTNEDLEAVWLITQASYAFARGEL